MEEPSYLQRRDVRIKTSCHRTHRHSGHHTRHTRKLHRLEELRDMRGSVHSIILQKSRSFCNNRIRSNSRVVGVLKDNLTKHIKSGKFHISDFLFYNILEQRLLYLTFLTRINISIIFSLTSR